MFIEKSPYHMSKAKIKSDNGISAENEGKKNKKINFLNGLKVLSIHCKTYQL